MDGVPTADEIAQCVLKTYEALPRKGKAAQREWSILSGVVMETTPSMRNPEGRGSSLRTVALGTGSKCMGANMRKKCVAGSVVGDGHAEIIARRSFRLALLRALKTDLDAVMKGNQPQVFVPPMKKSGSDPSCCRWTLREGIRFHLYVSQTPCGDASIFPISERRDACGPSASSIDVIKRKRKDNYEGKLAHVRKRTCTQQPQKRDDDGLRCVAGDIQRTGAKAVCEGEISGDPYGVGADYHTVGLVRLKPGQGDRTSSMSCSDKIARWNYIGVQGALLSLITHPVYFSSVIVGDIYHEIALERALIKRLLPEETWAENTSGDTFNVNTSLSIAQTSLPFRDGKAYKEQRNSKGRISAAGTCLANARSLHGDDWSMAEVILSAYGVLLGAPKRQRVLPRSWSSLCPRKYSAAFLVELTKHRRFFHISLPQQQDLTYRELKESSREYQIAKGRLESREPFSHWIGSMDDDFRCTIPPN